MTDQVLQAELLRRMALDQAARDQVQGYSTDPRLAEWATVRQVDANNTTWLADLIATIGWPLLSRVGDEAATAAWLIAQHADDAPELQLIFHQQMTAATTLGESSPRLLAYLEDRIRINAGRPQLYGTQFVSDDAGELRPQPVDDPDALDERRNAVGLEPFEDYEATMHSTWTRDRN